MDERSNGNLTTPESERGSASDSENPRRAIAASKIEALRQKLLDLSLANRLLSFKHSNRSRTHVRIIDEVPERILEQLRNEGPLTFKPMPLPPTAPEDERSDIFKQALEAARSNDLKYQDGQAALGPRPQQTKLLQLERELRNRVRALLDMPPWEPVASIEAHARALNIEPSYDLPLPADTPDPKHGDEYVQTLLYPEQLDSKLAAIRSAARTLEQDAGIAALYAAVGFLEWYESGQSSEPHFAPLLFVHIELERVLARGVYSYRIAGIGEDVEVNVTLLEKLRKDFGLELPAWDDEVSLPTYFGDVERIVSGRDSRWRIRRWVTVGVFTFARLVMYRDLARQCLSEHPILLDLFAGSGRPATIDRAKDYDIDYMESSEACPLLITEADTSQHSALIDALEGRNLVIEGPPGTGKSQTITNLIAAAVFEGKTVLFVAEKMAALEVVKKRLDGFGLGEFCLELHSSGRTRKSAVLRALEKRMVRQWLPADATSLASAIRHREDKRAELRAYVDAMNEKVGQTGLTVHEVLWGHRVREESFAQLPTGARGVRMANVTNVDRQAHRELIELARAVEEQERGLAPWSRSNHPWRGVQPDGLGSLDVEQAVAELGLWDASLKQVETAVDSLADVYEWRMERTLAAARAAAEVVERLPVVPPEVATDLVAALLEPSNRDAARRWCEASILIRNGNEAIAEHFDAHRVGGIELERLVELSASIASAALGDLDLPALRARMKIAQTRLNSIQEASTLARTLAAAFGMVDPSLGTLRLMVVAARLVHRLPRGSFALRSTEVMDERNLVVLRNAARTVRDLLQTGSELHELLELSDVSAVQLRAAAAAIRDSGVFSRWFGRDYRGALRLHSLLSGGRRGRPADVRRELERAGAHLAAVARFESDPAIPGCCGGHFRGIRTAFDDLLRTAEWARDVRAALPPSSGASGRLRSLMLSGSADEVEHILETVDERAVNGLASLLDTIDADPEATLSAIADDARHELDRVGSVVAGVEQLGPREGVRLSDVEALTAVKRRVVAAEQVLNEAATAQRFLGAKSGLSIESVQTALGLVDSLTASGLPAGVVSSLLTGPLPERLAGIRKRLVGLRGEVAAAARAQGAVAESLRIDFVGWHDGTAPDDVPIEALRARCNTALEHPAALAPYATFLCTVGRAADAGVGPIFTAFDAVKADYQGLPAAVDACYFNSLARRIFDSDPRLRNHAGATHDAIKARFQELDKEVLELHRRQLVSKLLAVRVPPGNGVGPRKEWTGLALLQHQVSLKRSSLPLRGLFARAGAAVQALKPCFMMSPMSIAQHLPAEGPQFDLVIMDEASQLRPEDALGAIARGGQLVVVGDPQQLPPTSFFEKLEIDGSEGDDEEVEDTYGVESILDLGMATFRPVRRLKWHYRSEHPGLIRFSNREFYDDELIIFPSPFANHPDRGVKLVEVGGTYSARRNESEAAAIVEEAARLIQERPDASFGIVAMNQPQSELIEAKLDACFATDPAAEAYRQRRANSLEPVFVKNLENVQGDERDVILISTVYGKNEEGAFFQRFGPINSATGHRRLNVLFTRAKQQVIVFSSMRASDIRIDEATRRGVRVLRSYLEFANTGTLTQPHFSCREPDSDFERWFITRLEREGLEVVPQLGVAGFFIDIAIRHPDEPGSFILGVECDGRTYHSSRSARDRDRLRQEILEDRGWELHRIWSTDWFRNSEYEVKRLLERIRELRAARHPPRAIT